MTPRAARTQQEKQHLAKGRKDTQRERLLTGMVTTANRDGYAGANVSKIIAEAGVSRPTFYDYFTDKDDCFLAALTYAHERLLEDVREAVSAGAPERATQAAIGVLVEFAATEPVMARFVMSEAMAAGPTALDARDEGIAEIEEIIEAAWRKVPSAVAIADVCPRIVIGGVYRLLASRLRRREPGLGRLTDALQTWIESYRQPASKQRWRTLAPALVARAPALLAPAPLPAPSPLPPGRPGLSREEEVAANHRQRIMYAAAQLAEQKGYNATTIADITKAASVDGRAFYAVFANKQDAFMAVHELGVQQVMNAAASAFFTGATWPERVWGAGLAFTQFLEADPLITYVGFVEANAVGPGAVQRVEDSHAMFTIFLQEGYHHQSQVAAPSRLALEAIIKTIFEIVYHEAGRREIRRSRGCSDTSRSFRSHRSSGRRRRTCSSMRSSRGRPASQPVGTGFLTERRCNRGARSKPLEVVGWRRQRRDTEPVPRRHPLC